MGGTVLIEHCHCGKVISGPPNGWVRCPAGHEVQLSDGTD